MYLIFWSGFMVLDGNLSVITGGIFSTSLLLLAASLQLWSCNSDLLVPPLNSCRNCFSFALRSSLCKGWTLSTTYSRRERMSWFPRHPTTLISSQGEFTGDPQFAWVVACPFHIFRHNVYGSVWHDKVVFGGVNLAKLSVNREYPPHVVFHEYWVSHPHYSAFLASDILY